MPLPRQPPVQDNWYRDDWFNKQEQWQLDDPYSALSRSYQYHREADDRQITRFRSPSPERPRWTGNREQVPYQNRSLDRGMGGFHEGAKVSFNLDLNRELPPPPPSPFDNIGNRQSQGFSSLSSRATAAFRAAAGFSGRSNGAGRRLPQPPPEGQKAMPMPLPATPLPQNVKPDRLSTRNRRLPMIPSDHNVNGGTMGHNHSGNNQSITNSIFGLAKKLTSSRDSNGINSGHRIMNQHDHNLAMGPNLLRNSTSFNNQFGVRSRPGRGAILPTVPTAEVMPGRRTLPDRSVAVGRSQESETMLLPSRTPSMHHTILEVGRGVRKLPVPLVKTSSRPNGGPFEQIIFNRSLDETTDSANPMSSEWT